MGRLTVLCGCGARSVSVCLSVCVCCVLIKEQGRKKKQGECCVAY